MTAIGLSSIFRYIVISPINPNVTTETNEKVQLSYTLVSDRPQLFTYVC